jgi:hypothetical protein
MVDFKKALVVVKNQKANGSFYSIERDGITQSALATFLECRQKARWYLQGWSPKAASMGMTYGNVIHAILEYAYDDIRTGKFKKLPSKEQVKTYTSKVEKLWKKEHVSPDKKSLEYLELSLLIAEATMPVYFEFWHKDVKELPWKRLEMEFKIPYDIAGQCKTFLRGKMDGVYERGKEWLFETKTASRIEEGDLVDMLPFEHQNMFYLSALRKLGKKMPAGVTYNIVRRVQLQKKKNESIQQFAKRCVLDIRTRPEFYFVRMEIKITTQELDAFDAELDAMILDFYLWWSGKGGHYRRTAACINKYGRCNYLTACATGKMGGYEKRKAVYRELEDL